MEPVRTKSKAKRRFSFAFDFLDLERFSSECRKSKLITTAILMGENTFKSH